MGQTNRQAEMTEQYILNAVYEKLLKSLVVMNAGYDGSNTQLPIAQSMSMKLTQVGSVYYIGIAAPGTAEATAKWQAFKLDTSSGIKKTYADGNPDFDNVATDLTALSYV